MKALDTGALVWALVLLASPLLASPLVAQAQESAAATALTVTQLPVARGDGLLVVQVVVSGGPAPREKESTKLPELPLVQCQGASVLPATPAQPPSIIVPATRRAKDIACTAELREETKSFVLKVKAPQPGLYVKGASNVSAFDGVVAIESFIKTKSGNAAPAALRVVASAGAATVGNGGGARVELPKSNAPRVIAVVAASEGKVGATFVPVSGVTTLPVKTRRRATIMVRIAGASFGPLAAPRGRVKAEIRVPPGARKAVVRATTRTGFIREKVTDLRTPDLAAVAAIMAHERIVVGATSRLLVAHTGANGRPATKATLVMAKSERGRLGPARSVAAGVWTFDYTAPSKSGADSIEVTTPTGARTVVPVMLVPGAPSAVAVKTEKPSYGPNSDLSARITIVDSKGNLVDDPGVSASIAGERANVRVGEEDYLVSGRVPKVLPADGVKLVVKAGAFNHESSLPVRPGPPVKANIVADASSREAFVDVEVFDEFGNRADPKRVEIELVNATGALEPTDSQLRGTIVADAKARDAVVEIRAAGRVLSRKSLEFDPPPSAFILGTWVNGGWGTNGGRLDYPRVGAGLALRRGVGPLEMALISGVEGATSSETSSIDVNGEPMAATWSVSWLTVPTTVRARLPLSHWFGVFVGGGVSVMRAATEIETTFQTTEKFTETIFGFRGGAGLDLRLGPGRFVATGEYTTGKLRDGGVRGQLGGTSFVAGYEWWFADLGPR